MSYNNGKKFEGNNKGGYNKGGNRNNNKKFTPSKPVTVQVPFVVSGVTDRGYEYNADSANTLVSELVEAGCFKKLTVMADCDKATLFGNDAKGSVKLARIMDFDANSGQMSLLFFGRNVDHAEKMNDMAVVPSVLFDRESGDVTNIASFRVVPLTEA